MVRIENVLRLFKITLHALLFAPRHRQHPIQIVPRDIGFGRHRAHLLKFLHFLFDFFLSFFGKLGLVDTGLDFGKFIITVRAAKLCLYSLHLLIEIIFSLCLFHLALYAAPDFLLDFQHTGFAANQVEDLIQSRRHFNFCQKFLFFRNIGIEMNGDNIR